MTNRYHSALPDVGSDGGEPLRMGSALNLRSQAGQR